MPQRWLPALLIVAVFGILVTLGLWQWARGDAKAGLLARAAQGAAGGAISLEACPEEASEHQRVIAEGSYLTGGQVLVDNRIHSGAPGYEVVTALRLRSGEVLAVNRGWVPLGPDRATPPRLPVPVGEVSVAGTLRRPSHNPLVARASVEQVGDVRRVRELYPQDVAGPGQAACALTLLMDADSPGGFVRDWTLTVMSPQRHYAYAVQWFALAVAVMILGVWMWRRP